jgi:hypothetical protein
MNIPNERGRTQIFLRVAFIIGRQKLILKEIVVVQSSKCHTTVIYNFSNLIRGLSHPTLWKRVSDNKLLMGIIKLTYESYLI